MEAEETAYGEWDDKRRSRDTFHGVICLHRVRPAILTSLSLTKPTSLISEAMVGVGCDQWRTIRVQTKGGPTDGLVSTSSTGSSSAGSFSVLS